VDGWCGHERGLVGLVVSFLLLIDLGFHWSAMIVADLDSSTLERKAQFRVNSSCQPLKIDHRPLTLEFDIWV
jgi:hypothetical protein